MIVLFFINHLKLLIGNNLTIYGTLKHTPNNYFYSKPIVPYCDIR